MPSIKEDLGVKELEERVKNQQENLDKHFFVEDDIAVRTEIEKKKKNNKWDIKRITIWIRYTNVVSDDILCCKDTYFYVNILNNFLDLFNIPTTIFTFSTTDCFNNKMGIKVNDRVSNSGNLLFL